MANSYTSNSIRQPTTPLKSNDPCEVCDRFPYSTKSQDLCPEEDCAQAREKGYCTFARVNGVWATIDRKNIYIIGSNERISRDSSILHLRLRDLEKNKKDVLTEKVASK